MNTKKDKIHIDHTSLKEFVDHYEKQSLSESSLNRMSGIVDCCQRWLKKSKSNETILNVADIACNTGELGRMWAKLGHKVYGLEVNEPILNIAKDRALAEGLYIDYVLGTATDLPWDEESMDVCLVPELLEHVVEWDICLKEFVRVLKPGGLLYISTTNKLCPKQQEFSLPLYSWYPNIMKRYFEKLAVTTHPQLAGYAKYPAVNWFSFYGLSRHLLKLGLKSFDRFDIMDVENKSMVEKTIINVIRSNQIVRCFAHVATPGCVILAVKSQ